MELQDFLDEMNKPESPVYQATSKMLYYMGLQSQLDTLRCLRETIQQCPYIKDAVDVLDIAIEKHTANMESEGYAVADTDPQDGSPWDISPEQLSERLRQPLAEDKPDEAEA